MGSQAGTGSVALNIRYFERRAAQEAAAARTAVTQEARNRRLTLAAQFKARAAELAI